MNNLLLCIKLQIFLLVHSCSKCVGIGARHILKFHGSTPVLDTHLFHSTCYMTPRTILMCMNIELLFSKFAVKLYNELLTYTVLQ